MVTARHVKQVGAAISLGRFAFGDRSEGCKVVRKNLEIRAQHPRRQVVAPGVHLLFPLHVLRVREGKHFVVPANEKLTAFVELERAIHELAVRLSLTSSASDKGATPDEVWPSINFSWKASAKYPGPTK